MAEIILSRLNEQGLDEFWRIIDDCRDDEKNKTVRRDSPSRLLQDPVYSEIITESVKLNSTLVFQDRFEFGKYLLDQLTNLAPDSGLDDDAGMWSWICALYWDQLTVKRVNRQEHYIPSIGKLHGRFGHERIDYRHSARTPFHLVMKLGEKARFFLSGRSFGEMGDPIEQILSRPNVYGNTSLLETILFKYSESNGLPIKGAFSEPKRKKNQNGKWSKSGYGGARRLVKDVVPRIKITYNVDDMKPAEILSVAGTEFA